VYQYVNLTDRQAYSDKASSDIFSSNVCRFIYLWCWLKKGRCDVLQHDKIISIYSKVLKVCVFTSD